MNSKLTFSSGMSITTRTNRVLATMVIATASLALASVGSGGQQPGPATATTASKPVVDAQAPLNAQGNGIEKRPPATAENEKKRQINDEGAKLLTMALSLKAEVDKTTKDTLSLDVIRKADEIEKLAHTVKERMKSAVGPS